MPNTKKTKKHSTPATKQVGSARISKRKVAGYSLVELLVVATIMIVLTTIGIVSFRKAGETARNAKRQSDLATMQQALILFRADSGQYPVAASGTRIPVAALSPKKMQFIPQAHAATGPTATPGFGGAEEEPTPTNTPVPTQGLGANPTATPVPTMYLGANPTATSAPGSEINPVTEDGASTGFQGMENTLQANSYLDPQNELRDPRPTVEYYYDYSSDGSTFTLQAYLEPDATLYELRNP